MSDFLDPNPPRPWYADPSSWILIGLAILVLFIVVKTSDRRVGGPHPVRPAAPVKIPAPPDDCPDGRCPRHGMAPVAGCVTCQHAQEYQSVLRRAKESRSQP